MFKAIKQFLATEKSKKKSSFFDLAKEHIAKRKGAKENLALNMDKILYGKS